MKPATIAVITIGLLGAASEVLAASHTSNPAQYAIDSSKAFAIGDSNDDSGWQECAEVLGTAPLTIQCLGTRQTLVHGGEMVTRSFTCQYVFLRVHRPFGYFVSEEACWE